MKISNILLTTIFMGARAMASPAPKNANVVTAESTAAGDPCVEGAFYCGWFLGGMGFSPIDNRALYYCSKPRSAVWVNACDYGEGCKGPSAHCDGW
ncbi:uncharacterized protein BDR25DRAFT_80369 [Lindgomyces ingoldianus]|uniref:Uncharacterized protein n=1 Tax=Lindgomyces ingoldianus TaxID=673940 RepID=A0ACB6QFZ1_9PLEO|nr:uncharacterized protein BDR25DRAFT_80369 [Lindgomyces ingoldianus]KAF2465849.1 hypothetical protein BDR25DRAFT_80369 [Lindgomyces ingoldianus]